MTSVQKWEKKSQPLLSAECNSYEGFVEKQVFPPWKGRAAFFCFSSSHLEFTMHSFRRGNKTECCCGHVNELLQNQPESLEEKGLRVKFQAACGSANLDNDIVGFSFHIVEQTENLKLVKKN